MKTFFAIVAICGFALLESSWAAEKKPAKAAPAAARPAAKPKRDPYPVTVKDLPKNWDKRVAAEKKNDSKHLEEVLESCTTDSGLEPQDLDFLRRHRDAAIAVLQKATAENWREGAAFETLLALGAHGARERWYAEFRKGDAKARAALLAIEARDERNSNITDPRNADEVAMFLDAMKKGPGFTPEAAFRLHDLTPVASALIDQLPEMTSRQWEIAGVLAENPLSREYPLPAAEARRLLAWVRDHPRKEEDELAKSLELVMKILKLGGETAGEAEKLFAELHEKKPDELQNMRSFHIVYGFCSIASPASRPLIEQLYKAPGDGGYRAAVFRGIARLRGVEVLPELEPLINGGEHEERRLWRALEILAENGAREQIDAWVLKKFPKLNDYGISYAVTYGGPEVMKRALAQSDIGSSQRFDLRWRLDGTTLTKFFERLKVLGIVDRLPTDAEIKAARRYRSDLDIETREATSLLEDLGCMYVVDEFAETDPPPYTDLLHSISAFTHGAFSPAAVTQEEIVPNRDPERRERFPNSVSFGASGKLLTFRGGPYGRRYDLGAVHAAVNRALAVAGRKERLMSIPSDDTQKLFVFGLPELWKQFAADFSLPFSENPLPPRHED